VVGKCAAKAAPKRPQSAPIVSPKRRPDRPKAPPGSAISAAWCEERVEWRKETPSALPSSGGRGSECGRRKSKARRESELETKPHGRGSPCQVAVAITYLLYISRRVAQTPTFFAGGRNGFSRSRREVKKDFFILCEKRNSSAQRSNQGVNGGEVRARQCLAPTADHEHCGEQDSHLHVSRLHPSRL
jgi:hypothetical protein